MSKGIHIVGNTWTICKFWSFFTDSENRSFPTN